MPLCNVNNGGVQERRGGVHYSLSGTFQSQISECDEQQFPLGLCPTPAKRPHLFYPAQQSTQMQPADGFPEAERQRPQQGLPPLTEPFPMSSASEANASCSHYLQEFCSTDSIPERQQQDLPPIPMVNPSCSAFSVAAAPAISCYADTRQPLCDFDAALSWPSTTFQDSIYHPPASTIPETVGGLILPPYECNHRIFEQLASSVGSASSSSGASSPITDDSSSTCSSSAGINVAFTKESNRKSAASAAFLSSAIQPSKSCRRVKNHRIAINRRLRNKSRSVRVGLQELRDIVPTTQDEAHMTTSQMLHRATYYMQFLADLLAQAEK